MGLRSRTCALTEGNPGGQQKIANFWNPYWGEKGFFRICRGAKESRIESSRLWLQLDATWALAGEPEERAHCPGVLWQEAPHPRFATEAPGVFKVLMGVLGIRRRTLT